MSYIFRLDEINWIKVKSPKDDITSISAISSQGIYFGTNKGDLHFSDYNDSKCLLLYRNISDSKKNHSLNTIAVNPYHGSDIYAGFSNSNGILKSCDFGIHWNQVLSINKTYNPVHMFSLCFASSNIIFAGTNIGLFISINNGDKWDVCEYSIEMDYYSIVKDEKDNIWFGTSNGLYLKRKNERNLRLIALKYVPVKLVISLPDNTLLLLTGVSIFTALKKFSNAVFVKGKGGKKPKNILPSVDGESVFGICADSNNNIVIAKSVKDRNSQNSLIEYSCDSGKSWTNISNGISHEEKIECFTINPLGYVYAGTAGGLYRSLHPIMEIKNANNKKKIKNHNIRKLSAAILLSFIILIVGLIVIPQLSPSFSGYMANKLRSSLGPEFVANLESVSFRLNDLYDNIYYRIFNKLPSEPIQNNILLSENGNNTTKNDNRIISADSLSKKLSWSNFGPLVSGKMILESSISSPDSERPYVKVVLVKIDLSQLDLNIMPGLEHQELISDTSLMDNLGEIPKKQYPKLLAAFNGGFRRTHGNYGFMINGQYIISPKKDIATIGIYRNGAVKIGAWERDIFQDANLITFRQNCPLLIDKYKINSSAKTGRKSEWGYTLYNDDPTWRSGVGISKNSRYLIYAGGKSLTVENLAVALKEADSYFAMQLDINPQWVCFVTYNPNNEKTSRFPVTAVTIFSQMTFSKNLFLEPFDRDFFYITKKYD